MRVARKGGCEKCVACGGSSVEGGGRVSHLQARRRRVGGALDLVARPGVAPAAAALLAKVGQQLIAGGPALARRASRQRRVVLDARAQVPDSAA